MTNETISIPLSKSKMLLLILISIGFIATGIWILTEHADEQTRLHPILAKGIGIFAVIFFSAIGIMNIRKLFDHKPGLIISEAGILDNSRGFSVGLIKWEDIIGLEEIQVMSTKILLIHVINPEEYIVRVTNKINAGSMRYGTPISLSTSTLAIKFNELFALLKSRHEQYLSKKSLI